MKGEREELLGGREREGEGKRYWNGKEVMEGEGGTRRELFKKMEPTLCSHSNHHGLQE